MKLLLGKETKTGTFTGKDHKIVLEDDPEYKELTAEPQIFCLISKDDAIKITKFIKHVSILGVDNEAVKLMYGLKDGLIAKVDERKVENIIDTA